MPLLTGDHGINSTIPFECYAGLTEGPPYTLEAKVLKNRSDKLAKDVVYTIYTTISISTQQ